MSHKKVNHGSLADKYRRIGEQYAELAKYYKVGSPLTGEFTLVKEKPLHPRYETKEDEEEARKRGSTSIEKLLHQRNVVREPVKGLADLGMTASSVKKLIEYQTQTGHTELLPSMNKEYRTLRHVERLERELKSKLYK